jgi:hypothetical protein
MDQNEKQENPCQQQEAKAYPASRSESNKLKHEITIDAKEGAPSEKPTGLCWIDARQF